MMSGADVVSLASLALGSWALGFGFGLLITSFRKFMDKL
jgi:hypothetical protein